MKINHENMKVLAEKLDHIGAKLPDDLTVDDVCNMAYQLQYFFEAMEKLHDLPGNPNVDADTVYKIIDLFDAALVDKVPA